MSTRGLPNELAQPMQLVEKRPFWAVEFLFDSPNELRLWSGLGDFVYDGETYTGAGHLLQISEMQETSDISARGASMSLSGIPSSLISLALDEPYQGRTVKVKIGLRGGSIPTGSFLALNDTPDYLIVDSPDGKLDISYSETFFMFDIFIGLMDQMNIEDNGTTATIGLAVESKLIDLNRPRGFRYTDQAQRTTYSDDKAFEFVSRLQNEDLSWGSV